MSASAARVQRALALLLGVGVVALLGGYLALQHEHIADHYALEPLPVLAIAAATAAILALRALQNQLVFRRLGVSASYLDWLGVVTVSSFTNYLPLSAGLVAKAWYLKRVHATSYRSFAVGQAAILLLVLASNGAVGLVLIAPAAAASAKAAAVAAGFALMLASGALLWLPERTRIWSREEWLARELASARVLRRAWPGACASQIGVLLCAAATLWLAFGLGAARVTFSACVLFSAASVLTSIVSITPGALGIREFLIGGLAFLTGFDPRDAVIASTLARVIELSVIALLGGALSYRLSKRVVAAREGSPHQDLPPRSG